METPPAEAPAEEGTISPEELQQELELLRSRLAEADKRVAAAAAVQVRHPVSPYLGALLLLGGHEICTRPGQPQVPVVLCLAAGSKGDDLGENKPAAVLAGRHADQRRRQACAQAADCP